MAKKDLRLEALKRFSIAITVLNVAGHLFLGFEQSWVQPLTALATAYVLEIVFECLNSWILDSSPRFLGSFTRLVHFLMPAHITGLAVSMLLFTNETFYPVVFATAAAILSKYLLRVNIHGHKKHFLNPSNTGIAITLVLFPWIGIAPPYQFTENITGYGDWLLPLVFIGVGSFLNARLTKRIVLIASWFVGFAMQAILRSVFSETSVYAALNPFTGVAFLLFSFYMISDPATTPMNRRNQVVFGLSIAGVYGLLVAMGVVFGQFFALFIVCMVRGIYLAVRSHRRVEKPERQAQIIFPRAFEINLKRKILSSKNQNV